MTEMEQAAVAPLGSASDALARLGAWVTAARHAAELVGPLVDTPFVPEAYRPKVDPRATDEEKAAARRVAQANATAAVLQGITLGLDPLTALQQIYIVGGRPGMYARAKVALVIASGHEVWTEDLSDSRVVVCGRRAGSTHIERVVITMDMARKAGWTRNPAYQSTPQDMLYARAASRVCDRIAPERLLGIATIEEVQDAIATVDQPAGRRRTVRPPARKPAGDEPPLEDPQPAGEPPAPAVIDDREPGISVGQSRRLWALLRSRGRAERAAALEFITGVIGRAVESTKDLTGREAGLVIDALERDVAGEPELDQATPAAAVDPAGEPEQPTVEDPS